MTERESTIPAGTGADSGADSAAAGRTAQARKIESVCVFCASSNRGDPAHRAAARRLGGVLAEAGFSLVFGGGHVGLMGEVSDGAMDAGGYVIGVIPEFLVERELGHGVVSELIRVDSMHVRKQKMFDLSQAAIVLPGGLGTLDETVEMITWRQLGLHDNPILIVNMGGFFDPMLALFEHIYAHNYGHGDLADLYHVGPDVDAVVPQLQRLKAGVVHIDAARL